MNPSLLPVPVLFSFSFSPFEAISRLTLTIKFSFWLQLMLNSPFSNSSFHFSTLSPITFKLSEPSKIVLNPMGLFFKIKERH